MANNRDKNGRLIDPAADGIAAVKKDEADRCELATRFSLASKPSDLAIQDNWLENHQGADFVTMDKNKQPAIAVYVNPIWKDKQDTEKLVKYIFEYLAAKR